MSEKTSSNKSSSFIEISIYFQFDCCPGQKGWEIWTSRGEYYHNNDGDRSQHLDRLIIDSKTYYGVKPYTSIEDKIRLDAAPFNLTLTVFDTSGNGFETKGGDFYYQVNRTEYDFIRDNKQNRGGQWVTHQENIATIHGEFHQNNYILTRDKQQGQQQHQQNHQNFEIKHLKAGQQNSNIQGNDKFANVHHHGYFYSVVINFMLIVSVIFIGIYLFIGIKMYRTRQRGTGVEALDKENSAFLHPRCRTRQTRGQQLEQGEEVKNLITGEAGTHIPHFVTVELGEI